MNDTTHRLAPPDLELMEVACTLLNDAYDNDHQAPPGWLAGRDQWHARYRAYIAGRVAEDVTCGDLGPLAYEAHRLVVDPAADPAVPFDQLPELEQAAFRTAGAAVWAATFSAWLATQTHDYRLADDEEPPVEEYNPGDEVDDQGGMSERWPGTPGDGV